MKFLVLLAAVTAVSAQSASANLYKCSLLTKIGNAMVTRMTTGYVNTNDDVTTRSGVRLAQIELNARGGTEPYATVTAFKNGNQDVVSVQLMKGNVYLTKLQDMSASVSANGYFYRISCAKVE